MCRGISFSEQSVPNSSSKNNLIERIGGEQQYDFLVLTYAENIHEDKRLQQVFQDYDIDELTSLQKDVLDVAFLHSKGKLSDDETRNRIVLRNFALFEKGLNEKHFDILQQHFVAALHDCWVEDETFDLCEESFEDLRQIFEENGREINNSLIQ